MRSRTKRCRCGPPSPRSDLGRAARDIGPVVPAVGGVLEIDRTCWRARIVGAGIGDQHCRGCRNRLTRDRARGLEHDRCGGRAAFTSWVTGVSEVDPSKFPSPE